MSGLTMQALLKGFKMQKGKVNIAQGYPETLSNLKIFMENQKKAHPEKQLKTLADAIDFAIEQVEKLENNNKNLIKLSQERGDKLAQLKELYQPKLDWDENRVDELEKENLELKKRIAEFEKEGE